MIKGKGSGTRVDMYPAPPMLIVAPETIAVPTTSSPVPSDSHSLRKAAFRYAASLALTGMRVASSANVAALNPMITAAAMNASGACVPLRPAAIPTST
jgi:hypothetical protein